MVNNAYPEICMTMDLEFSYSMFCTTFSVFTSPEMLLSNSSILGIGAGGNIGGDIGDAIEANKWKCIRTMNDTLSWL